MNNIKTVLIFCLLLLLVITYVYFKFNNNPTIIGPRATISVASGPLNSKKIVESNDISTSVDNKKKPSFVLRKALKECKEDGKSNHKFESVSELNQFLDKNIGNLSPPKTLFKIYHLEHNNGEIFRLKIMNKPSANGPRENMIYFKPR